jgi:hypothetical protein
MLLVLLFLILLNIYYNYNIYFKSIIISSYNTIILAYYYKLIMVIYKIYLDFLDSSIFLFYNILIRLYINKI